VNMNSFEEERSVSEDRVLLLGKLLLAMLATAITSATNDRPSPRPRALDRTSLKVDKKQSAALLRRSLRNSAVQPQLN